MKNLLINKQEILNAFKYDIMTEIIIDSKSNKLIGIPEDFFIMIDGIIPIALDEKKLAENQVKLYLSYKGFNALLEDIVNYIMINERINYEVATVEANKKLFKRHKELKEWTMEYIVEQEKKIKVANEIYVKNFC